MVFLLTNILNLNETFVDVSIVFTVLVIAYIASGYLLDIKDYVLYRKRNKELHDFLNINCIFKSNGEYKYKMAEFKII
jgi:hypothetical protein